MGNNHRGKLSAVQAQPTNIAAKLTITAFTDRPPVVADAIERANLPTNV